MAIIPKSKGCLTCRKVKVKCDLVRPECNRCRRLGRECRYPDKFTFVHNASAPNLAGKNQSIFRPVKQTMYTFTTEHVTDTGALYQKWHRSTLLSEPGLAPVEIQAFQFVSCLEHGRLGARMQWIGKWLEHVPRRLGTSDALDQSAVLMSKVHAAIMQNDNSSTWIDAVAYAQAVKSLRKAIMSPEECITDETLSAATILYYIEAILGCPWRFNAIHHAGGIARLLEVRGPPKLTSDFGISILQQVRGPLIGRSVMLGVPCFLASPSWTPVFNVDLTSEFDILSQELMKQLTSWSGLALEVRKFRLAPNCHEGYETLRNRITTFMQFMCAMNSKLKQYLCADVHVDEVPSARDAHLFSTVYKFKDHRLATVVALHAGLFLVVKRMMQVVSTKLPQKYLDILPWEIDDIEIVSRIHRIYEYAWNLRPMGAAFMHIPLTMSFPYARSEKLRAWILKALNELDEHLSLETARFSPPVVMRLAKMYTGEAPPNA